MFPRIISLTHKNEYQFFSISVESKSNFIETKFLHNLVKRVILHLELEEGNKFHSEFKMESIIPSIWLAS